MNISPSAQPLSPITSRTHFPARLIAAILLASTAGHVNALSWLVQAPAEWEQSENDFLSAGRRAALAAKARVRELWYLALERSADGLAFALPPITIQSFSDISAGFNPGLFNNPAPMTAFAGSKETTRILAALNTANDYTGSATGSLLNAGSWSLGHVPTVAEDAVFIAATGIRSLTTSNLTVGSFNVTASSGTFSIRNNTTLSTNTALILGGPGSSGNGVSGTLTDLLFAATGSTFNIIGSNGSTGTGVLNLVLGQSGNFNAAGAISVSSIISDGGGGFGITKTGAGTLALSGANTYGGGTTVSAGTLQLSGTGTLGATSGGLTINGGILDLNGTNQTVGALNGSGGTIKSSIGSSTLTVGNGGGTGSYAGSITNTGTIALTKTGAGAQTLTNNNSYKGATLVTGGTLELKNTGGVALSGTSGLTVNNGGTLLFSANNQINQATLPGITVDNGKLNAGGVSQGTGGTPAVPNSGTAGLGALTMNSSSVIDLTGASVFHFADSGGKTWTGTLSIWDWSGTSTTGGGTEQILFGGTTTGLTAGQLLQVSFYSDGGTTLISNTALILADGEIIPGPMTPVPEPSTWIGAALALGAVAVAQRRRLRSY